MIGMPDVPPRTDNGIGGYAEIVHLDKRATEDGWSWSLTIDGHEFPYLLAPDMVIPVMHDRWPHLVMTLYADQIQVENRADSSRPPHRWPIPELKLGRAGDPGDRENYLRTDLTEWKKPTGAEDGIPSLVQVRRTSYYRWELLIDGKLFPFRLGPRCELPVSLAEGESLPHMRFTLLTKRLMVDMEGPFHTPADTEGEGE